MTEEVELTLDEAKEAMQRAIVHLEDELKKVRAGKATPAMLEGVMVDYYGNPTPIAQTANINVLDSRTLSIQPWEKKIIPEIERGIYAANLGITPQNDGEVIRVSFPQLTEERRKDLVKRVKAIAEDTKVSIRNIRHKANDEIKKLKNDGLSEDLARDAEAEVQDLTNEYTGKVDKHVDLKEAEIMKV